MVFLKRPCTRTVVFSFEVALEPGEAWHTCLLYSLKDNYKDTGAPRSCVEHHSNSDHAETLVDWLRTVAKIQTSNEEFYRLFSSRTRGHGGAPPADSGHGSSRLFACCRASVVHCAIRTRQFLIVSASKYFDLSGIRTWLIGHPRLSSGKGRRSYRDAEPGKIFTNCATVS